MSRSKFAVLTVGGWRQLRYRRAPMAHPIDVNADLFLGNIKRSEKHKFSDRFCYTILAETDIIIEDKDSAKAHNSAIIRRKCCSCIFFIPPVNLLFYFSSFFDIDKLFIITAVKSIFINIIHAGTGVLLII